MSRKITRFLGILLSLSFVPLASTGAVAATPTVCSTMTENVYHSINPTTNASLLTLSSEEIGSASKIYGFTQVKGSLFKASSAPKTGLVPVQRIFKNDDFMWVPNPAGSGEYENLLVKQGYRSEQMDFHASMVPISCGVAVYRFVKDGQHRMVTKATERVALAKAGWKSEGIRFWASAPSAPMVVPQPTPTPTTPPVVVDPTPAPVPAPVVAPEVAWETIAKPGENINTVLAKPELAGKILKLPKGVFEVSNYLPDDTAIWVPPRVVGIIGEGRDTIIRMKPMTSTYAWKVPDQSQEPATNQLCLLRMNYGLQKQVIKNVWFQGTPQGHMQNGIMVGQSKPGTTVENVYFTGFDGNASAPPGETFGLEWWGGSGSITKNVEVDGYRWTGDTYASRVKGSLVGSSPIGYSYHNDAKLFDSYFHDSDVGMPTFWYSDNAETWNLQSVRNRVGINIEESFGLIHHYPVLKESKNRHHIYFMSNRMDGKLTVIGAINDEWISRTASGPVGEGKKLFILSPEDYTGPETNRIVTPPTVLMKDGVTKAPYLWADEM